MLAGVRTQEKPVAHVVFLLSASCSANCVLPSYYPIRGSDPLEVLNQIASYVYILAFAGSLVVVVLVELAEHAGGPRGPSRSWLRALG